MMDSLKRASRHFGVFGAVAIGMTTAVFIVGNADAQTNVAVNCPTETSKTFVQSTGSLSGVYQFDTGVSCYCSFSQPGMTTAELDPQVLPDGLTDRTEAQQALDFLYQNGSFAFAAQLPTWQDRLDRNFSRWIDEKLTDLELMRNDRLLTINVEPGLSPNSAVSNAFCYSLSQLQALYDASIANAQAVIALANFL